MTHLILCREYPPATYPAGGIGSYAMHLARQLAEAGETVHMVGERSERAPRPVEILHDGRLIVHRLSVTEPIAGDREEAAEQATLLRLLAWSNCPTQLFAWQAARYVERLMETVAIDVIEAQEWEAPLYYLQMRRLAGLGPERRPPCIVTLHSPTQLIFQHNELDTTLTDFEPLTRMEEWTIRRADALVCPSRYLAKQVADLFGLTPGSIEVIPYAMGVETPRLERPAAVWERNSICYVGRLELRKGILEWVDAAVAVASEHDDVSFHFFGADTTLKGGAGPSVLGVLRRRIPRAMARRFRFHGARSRPELLAALAESSAAVVPSRWENFPFTCIEAMSTGLPVLASPHGGMAEMVVDGQSGWIATDGTPEALATALRRMLSTPPGRRAAMGERAAGDIRRICDNQAVVARQIAFRRQVASRGAAPVHRRPSGEAPFAEACAHIFATQPGIGMVAPWVLHDGKDLDTGPCPASLTRLPDAALPDGAVTRPEAGADPSWRSLQEGGWTAMTYPGPPMRTVRGAGPRPKRRYSMMALIANQSLDFKLRWFLAAPLREKARWLAEAARTPPRVWKQLRTTRAAGPTGGAG
jgi:glycosyltransferase involved in cell wall biosynthesis